MSLSRFSRSLASIFRPPFEGLWLVVLLYVAWTFLVYPNSPILRGNLPDTDDYMYLAQLIDWLKGQNWYDNIQHRLDPPTGVPIHFSRLAMLPMAFLTLAFEAFRLPPHGAALLMALVWPLVLLGFFFIALRWTAENLMPMSWAGVTAFVGLFATGTLVFFAPGHVDHHGLIVVLIIAAMGCVMRMMKGDEDPRWGLYAGLIMALALAIALESLPWLLIISAVIGLRGIMEGGKAARNGFAYCFTLYLGSNICLLLTRPMAAFQVKDILSYSIVYVTLTACIAICLAGVAIVAKRGMAVRFTVGVLLALITGGWFLLSFPSLITGPYGAMDPALAQIMLGEITETQPLIGGAYGGWLIMLAYAASALVALPVGLAFMNYADKEERWCWRLLMALLAGAFALTTFYQRRYAGTMDALAVIPLSVLLWRGWIWAGRNLVDRPKVYAEIGFLLLAGPLPLLLLPALIDGRSLNTGVLLFPALTVNSPCDMYVLENVLRDPAVYGDRSRVIINSMSSGSELLFRTPHEVLSAPYHMDVAGNLDAARFFSTTLPSEAEAIARRRHADLVVSCQAVPDVYLHPPGETEVKDKPHFIQLLMTDGAPPWLKRVRFKGLNNYVIYEVQPSASPSPKAKTPSAE